MKKLLIIISLLITNISFANAQDQDKALKAKEFIINLGNGIIEISKNTKLPPKKRTDNIIALIDNSIDSKWISRFVLGSNYKSSTEKQRSRFKDLYRAFMINTYGPKFDNYKGDKFIVKDSIKQNRFYLVKTDFITKANEPPIAIDFRVREMKGKFVVLDFIAEGISLIETQRSEFSSAISTRGIDKFLDDLEERVNNLKASRN